MRKKFVKSDRPTYKRRITKAQEGIKFAKYTALETPQVDYSINNIDNPFSEYNIPITYNTEKALVVPEVAIKEEPSEVVDKPADEPIVANTVPASRTENNVTPSKFTGSKDFINKMRPVFAAALNKRGIDPKYTDYLVAQSALESKWGKAQSGKFNLGGIKGKGSVKRTREVINGKDVYINDSFRDFDSLEDYADYHVGLLNNKRYKAFSNDDFIGNVVRGKYATDPKYSNILNQFYRQVVKAEYGGIIKYQDGGVAKRDAIKDYKPQEKVSPIKRTYTPTQSYVSQDNRSQWQHEQDSKKADVGYNQYVEDKKTAQGLDRLNQFLTFTDYAGLATGVGSLLTKGVSYAGKRIGNRIAKDIASSQRLGIVAPQFQGKSDITERFIKFAGGKRNEAPVDVNELRGASKLQAQKLQEAGVDMSKVTPYHLDNALGQRRMQLMKTAPEGRFNIIEPDRTFPNAQYVKDCLKLNGQPEQQVGLTKLAVEDDILIGGTNNIATSPGIHKVEERGLNSAIQLSNQNGLKGVVTGEELLSAPKTYNVWKNFKDKELVGNYGTHSNTNMITEGIEKGRIKVTSDIDNETVINDISQMTGDATKRLTLHNAPVYRLTKQSGLPTKTKSTIFDPSIIDNTGKMNIDWNNPDIYKVLAPFATGLNLLHDDR